MWESTLSRKIKKNLKTISPFTQKNYNISYAKPSELSNYEDEWGKTKHCRRLCIGSGECELFSYSCVFNATTIVVKPSKNLVALHHNVIYCVCT